MLRAIALLLIASVTSAAHAAWPAQLSMCAVQGGQGVVTGVSDEQVLCVTASHLAGNVGDPISIRWPNGTEQDGKIVKKDDVLHLAAFTAPRKGARRLPFAIGTPVSGETLAAAHLTADGNIGGFRGTLSQVGQTTFWLTGRNEPGDSGGPVFDVNHGQLVGIMAARREEGEAETLAVSGVAIRGFVQEFVGGVVPVDRTTLDGALNDPDVKLTCDRLSTRLAANKFNVLSVNNVSANTDLAFGYDTLLAQVQLQNEQFAQLQKAVYELSQKTGKKGDKGDQGEAGLAGAAGADGAPGAQGPAGEVDYDKVWTWIREHKTEFASQPPEFVVNFLDGKGGIASSEQVKDGKINIPPVKAWWTRLDGKTEKQARPLGDALKFQTELRQAKGESK